MCVINYTMFIKQSEQEIMKCKSGSVQKGKKKKFRKYAIKLFEIIILVVGTL